MSDTRRLITAMRMYADHLDDRAVAASQRRNSGSIREPQDHLKVLFPEITTDVPIKYKLLNNQLLNLDVYVPVLLDDSIMLDSETDPVALTEDSGTRRSWHRKDFIRRMQLSCQCKIYSYDPKGGKTVLRFIWRVAEVNDAEASTQEARLIARLGKEVPHYLDRQTKAEFTARFSGVTNLSKAIIRNMMKCLTQDDSAAHDETGVRVCVRVLCLNNLIPSLS